MYFDEPLWRALVELVTRHAAHGTVEVLPEGKRGPIP